MLDTYDVFLIIGAAGGITFVVYVIGMNILNLLEWITGCKKRRENEKDTTGNP